MKPGVYSGLAMSEYLALPAVSAGLLHTLDTECPRAAWHASWLNPKREREAGTKEQDAGTVAHAILLEGSEECVCAIDPRDHPTEKTGNIPEGWTNKSIRSARDAAIAAGKVPILAPKLAEIRAMVAAARAYLDTLKATDARAVYDAFQPDRGESEVTLVWEDVIDGTPCRARPDRLANDRRLIVDYKSVSRSAEPNAFGRTIASMGYDMSVAHYRRGVLRLCNVLPSYVFFVQEVEPPYLCSLVGLEPAYVDFAQRRHVRSLSEFASCMRADLWPAYPPRVAHVELPGWVANQDEERAVARGNAYRPEQLFEIRDREQAARVVGSLPDFH